MVISTTPNDWSCTPFQVQGEPVECLMYNPPTATSLGLPSEYNRIDWCRFVQPPPEKITTENFPVLVLVNGGIPACQVSGIATASDPVLSQLGDKAHIYASNS